MTASFDLGSRPWIPCERLNGATVELSTADLLAEAHALRGLVDPSPVVLAALYRHLLAVLHRVHQGPRDMAHWVAIASAGRFDRDMIEGYLGTWRERMDLFHPTHPFAQTRGLLEEFGEEYIDPIDQLELERSGWGSARALFQHRPDHHRPTMPPARAARALLAHHAFAPGGLVRKPNEPTSATAAPLVRCAVVVLRGETLFQTLLANLLASGSGDAMRIGVDDDAPSWELAPLPKQLRVTSEPKRMPRGWLDALTWLSRRLELVHDGSHVTGFIRAVGQGMSEHAPPDAMVTYRRDEKRGRLSVGINPDRAFWRDANALFEAARDDGVYLRPRAIDHVERPQAQRVLGETARYSIEIFGIAADRSRVDAVRAEQIHSTLGVFDDPDAGEAVRNSLRYAESAVDALRAALRSYARHALAPGKRDPDLKDVSALLSALMPEAALWSALGVAFAELMRSLAEDPEGAEVRFCAFAHDLVRKTFGEVTAVDESGRSLKARAHAERDLQRHLRRPPRRGTLPEPTRTETIHEPSA